VGLKAWYLNSTSTITADIDIQNLTYKIEFSRHQFANQMAELVLGMSVKSRYHMAPPGNLTFL